MKRKKIIQTLALALSITSLGALSPVKDKQNRTGVLSIQEASAAITSTNKVISKVTQDNIIYAIMDNNEVQVFRANTASGYVEIPDNINGMPVTSIGNYAFMNVTPNYDSTGQIVSVSARGASNNLITGLKLPNTIAYIGREAFYNCTSLVSADLGISVKNIDNGAFAKCSKLSTVSTGNSLTSIGQQAFEDCTRLTSITIPDSVTAIGANAFYNCTGLTLITIPDSVTAIGANAFYNCTGLTLINMSQSALIAYTAPSGYFKVYTMDDDEATPLGSYLVKQGTNLSQYLDIPVKYGYTFDKWVKSSTASTSVIGNIQDNCTFIASYTQGTLNLPAPTITLSAKSAINRDSTVTAKVEGIQAGLNYVYTLDGSTPTTTNGFTLVGDTINIPKQDTDSSKTVTVKVAATTKGVYSPIASGTVTFLAGTVSSDPTTVQDGITYSVHNNGTATIKSVSKSITGNIAIPEEINGNKVTEVAQAAFKDCTGLTNVELPDTVTSIGAFAFQGCTGLTSIVLPPQITSLNGGTFSGCTNLGNVQLSENMTSIQSTDFDSCDSLNIIKLNSSIVNRVSLSNFNKVRFIDEDEATYLGGWYVRSGYSMVGKQTAPLKADKTFSKWTRYTPVSVSTLGDIEDNVVFEAVYNSTPGTQGPKVFKPILTPSKTQASNRETGVSIKIS